MDRLGGRAHQATLTVNKLCGRACRSTYVEICAAGLVLVLAACAAPYGSPTASAVATASAIPQVVSTRLMAELKGQLKREGECLRVQRSGSPQSILLVWPADFVASAEGDKVLVSDLLLKKVTTWHLGDIIDIAGGEIPRLDASLRPVPAACVGPYWVVGSIDPSATPTPPAVAPTVTPTPTPFTVLVIVPGTDAVVARGGPGTDYEVVGHLQPGQRYPVVAQMGPD